VDFSARVGHFLPPYAAEICSERWRNRMPPKPQDFEQPPQVPQWETTQSTGHACCLQAWVALREPHALPPWAFFVTTERVLYWEPVPQDLVQALKADHAESAQSMGR
jgi:hypothetical protein